MQGLEQVFVEAGQGPAMTGMCSRLMVMMGWEAAGCAGDVFGSRRPEWRCTHIREHVDDTGGKGEIDCCPWSISLLS